MNDGSHGIAKFRPFKIEGVNSMRWPLIALAAVFLLVAGGLSPMVALAQTPPDHYDTDGDGLIEIDSLAQLNAVRWDLDGNGAADNASNNANYAAAFPVAEDGSVCPAGTDCAGYELTANLDFDENEDGEITEADATYWNNGGGWLPIGRQGVTPTTDGERVPLDARLFHVTFDGNGHTIANLYADRSTSNAQGLFSVLGTGAEVRNLGLPGVDVTGNRYAGGLGGWSEKETSITAAWAIGKVVGHYDIGGLIGETFGSATRCWAAVDVTGQIHVGGLVGENEFSGTITDSYATGSVNGGDRDAGGLVGYNAAISGKETVGTIIRSYATGSVSGNANVGGLVGANDGTIKASYARGTVRGNLNFGGLTGYNTYGAIRGSYAVGTVSGRSHAGGLVGRNLGGPISASYYDSEVSGRGRDSGNKRTAELTAPTGYAGIYAGWNLDLDNADGDDDASTGGDDPWHFGTADQYPVLKADFNGDGTATWQEFGYQVRLAPRLSAAFSDAQVSLNWPDVAEPEWSGTPELSYVLYRDGKAVTDFDGRSRTYTDASPPPTDAGVAYQVALLLDGVERMRSNILSVSPTALRRDSDGDGLMEISSLDQLNAVRWDLDTNGRADRVGSNPGYTAAFPAVGSGSACVAGGDGNDGVPCTGYELATDLDFNDAASYASGSANMASWAKGDGSGAGWQPIGGDFTGVFDGGGHTIANLYINRPSNDYVGLFGQIRSGAAVRNLGLRGVEITGKDYVGGLAGFSASATINSSYVTGTISGNSRVGGLVGRTGVVTISTSYATGTVSGNRFVGGLVGLIWSGPVSASYATGTVSGDNEVGGLAGRNGGTISASYAAGTVSGNTNVGGLASPNSRGTISASYYDRDTSGLAGGKTTADLTNPTGYTGIYATWDDDGSDLWDFGTDQQYPALKVDFNGDNTATWQEFGYQVRDIDGAPLLALYNATGGANWQNNANWLSHRPLSEWHGVFTNEDGRVIRLHLDNNGLTGPIPAELGNLDQLLTLDLSANALTGPIPAQLGSLGQLVGLSLAGNRLTGPIPTELGNLAQLQGLVLSGNAFSGTIPTQLSGLSQLQGLYLSYNALTGTIPAELGSVASLQWLALAHNRLTGAIPTQLGSLSQLQGLHINDNGLTGPLPDGLTNLANLKYLRFEDTSLCVPTDQAFQDWLSGVALVSGSGDCPEAPQGQQAAPATGPGHVWLDTTDIVTREGHPAIAYTITLDVEPTENVVITVSSDNGDVTVQPASLTFTPDNWQTAQTVSVSVSEDVDEADDRATLSHSASGGNYDGVAVSSVTVSVTDDDSDREILRDFYHATGGQNWTNIGNWLSDRPLGEWHGVTTDGQGQVTHLALRDNNLSGGLPSQLGKLESLQVLSLDRNSISGSLPSELGNLSNLTRLAMNRNSLSGAIPSQLGSLSNLSIIGLANNDLSGTLPSELGNLSSLTKVSLHDNTALSGALPSGFTNLANLQRLAIANTGLCLPDTAAFDDWLAGVPDKPGIDGLTDCASP